MVDSNAAALAASAQSTSLAQSTSSNAGMPAETVILAAVVLSAVLFLLVFFCLYRRRGQEKTAPDPSFQLPLDSNVGPEELKPQPLPAPASATADAIAAKPRIADEMNEADVERDGQLSRAEFATFLAKTRPPPAARPRVPAASLPSNRKTAPLVPLRSVIHPIGGPPRGSVALPEIPPTQARTNGRTAALPMEASHAAKVSVYPAGVELR